jgi:squalene cyclase
MRVTTRVAGLDEAIAAARDYVLALQAPDGSWTDWELPPGSSSIWTTAYVGWQLHELRDPPSAGTAQAASRAARWLLERRFHDGGWGYSETVGSDADSTSFCILLLDAVHGGGAPAAAVDHLLGYQRPDGGFATYRPDVTVGSWAASHPDVTPVALRALLPRLGVRDHRIRAGIARVLGDQNDDGVWPSFWWSSSSYATRASIALLRAVGARYRRSSTLSRTNSDNAFETALLLSCELEAAGVADGTADRTIAELIDTQRPDGSWTSVPMLRVTRRECFEPWRAADPGPLFADPRRLFTTATALAALTLARRLGAAGLEPSPRVDVSAVRPLGSGAS